MKIGRKVRSIIQHYGNSRHIYCRLCMFLPCTTARRYAVQYEHLMQRFLYAPAIPVD